MRFSALRIIKEGLTGNANWEPHWRNPSPKSKYDVIIIGGCLLYTSDAADEP